MLPSSTRAAATKAKSNLLRRTNASTASKSSSRISTIIFDVDDTLYDVSSGFTAHRNGEVIWRYMVEHCGFGSLESARAVRDEYFAIYHSTAKALMVAQAEGKFPPSPTTRPFDAKHMSQYWVDNLDYDKLWGNHAYGSIDESKRATKEFGAALAKCPARLVAFSNGPRAYVMKVLDTLGLLELFGSDGNNNIKDGAFVWGVDDVLPHCKPEPEAFGAIFDKLEATANKDSNGNGNTVKINPEECVMVEDSMKNIRAAKALGMKTILIKGSREEGRILAEDAPLEDDPAVDVAFETVEEMTTRLPGLWLDPPVFEP
jgi:putative hydrolase of the HAD superfamily